MEEIQIELLPGAEQVDLAYNKFKTENDMLEMSAHFKDIVTDKNNQIKHLTKIITIMYGTLKFGEIMNDESNVIFLREYLEEEMLKLLGLDD